MSDGGRSAVVGILLAAGRSQRYGADKRWQPLADGMPMALRSAGALRAACDHVIVVLRSGDEDLALACRQAGCAVIHNTIPGAGIGDSLALAVSATREARGWLVALADMPFIAPSTYRLVLDALADGAAVARPVFQERAGHPVGFSAAWGGCLEALSGDRGARGVVEAAGDGCVLLKVDDAGVVRDVDQTGDLIERRSATQV